jgi:hypothetical protein
LNESESGGEKMSKANDAFRKMLESTLSETLNDQRKGKLLNAETDEKLAWYLLRKFDDNSEGTNLAGETPKPWAALGEMERQKEIALWSLEKYLSTLKE